MRALLGCVAGLFLAGSAARADEMDREAKGKSNSPVAAATNVAAGTELDKESPEQSHCCRHKWGWGGGYGGYYGGGGWSVGYYGGGWGVGYSSGWARPYYGGYGYGGYGGGYYRPSYAYGYGGGYRPYYGYGSGLYVSYQNYW
jgi:hypothetical protein